MWKQWQQLPQLHSTTQLNLHTSISVVIVVRNEAENLPVLLDSLCNQSYPADLVTVFIVDDFSTDQTIDIIKEYESKVLFGLRLLQLKEYPDADILQGNFKKKGIEWAVNISTAELIVTTDGDCIVPKHWLSSIATLYEQTKAPLICGPVSFIQTSHTLFAKVQTIEFASLIGSGAATLQTGIPTMCNAANLAFTKKAFQQVGGYQDTASTATGDDLFLLHKIHKLYPNQIRFLKDPQAVVHTYPQATLTAFYHQRKRWASKWHLYSDWRVSALAIGIFLCNVSLLLSIPAVFQSQETMFLLLSGILLRWLSEWIFLRHVLSFLGKGRLMFWIPLVQWIYPFYVVFFGLAAQKKGYSWKGRKLS